ncbi:sigma-70 family RNA polymerase sigma factor [Ruminococcaceae bacterium OttesenSCG-928-D13]|nr:sigma-70 family RNA polymerase sigma factor [Ruminococcaceae bacterium OttesenSCG-928-D13]
MFKPEEKKINNARFIEIEGEQIPVSEDVYRAYKRPLWAEHKRKEREKRCRDANGNRCIKDCSQCEKQRTGSALSLDKLAEAGFDVADPIDFTQRIEDELLIEALHIALDELAPLDRQIIDLFSAGKSEREIAAVVGMSQKGVNRRKARIFADLRERLKSFS